MDLTQRQALADLLRTQPAYNSPLAALVGDASANVRAGVGTAKAVTPTWRQKTAGLLQDGIEALGTDRYRARRIAETLAGGESSNLPLRMGLLDPTMIGAAFGRQESPNMGPGAPSGMLGQAALTTLFRAHGPREKMDRMHARSSWTPEKATARAYTENQGFGGPLIRAARVDIDDALDVGDIHSLSGKTALAKALGYDNPAETAQTWQDYGYRYPWEESGEVMSRLSAAGKKFLRYVDDYPSGAQTVVPLQDIMIGNRREIYGP